MNTEEKLIKKKKVFRNLFVIGLMLSILSFISIFIILLLPTESFEPLFEIIHSFNERGESNDIEIEIENIKPEIENNELKNIEPEVEKFYIDKDEFNEFLNDRLSDDTIIIKSVTIYVPISGGYDKYDNYISNIFFCTLLTTIILSFTTAFLYAGLVGATEELEEYQLEQEVKLMSLEYYRKLEELINRCKSETMINKLDLKTRNRLKRAHKISPELNWFYFGV